MYVTILRVYYLTPCSICIAQLLLLLYNNKMITETQRLHQKITDTEFHINYLQSLNDVNDRK